MSKRDLEAELGGLVETYRPGRARLFGWLAPLSCGVALGLFLGFGTQNIFASVAVSLVIAVLVFFMFAESCLVEHRLYEHGLVLRSLPGYPVLVIPHSSVDPDSFHIGGRKVHDGSLGMAVETGMDRRFRVAPFIGSTVRFVGLHPKRARRIGNGKLDWHAAISGTAPDGSPDPTPTASQWWVSYRDAERYCALIQQTVHRSQQTRPYQGHSG